jgi:hypothetical protein
VDGLRVRLVDEARAALAAHADAVERWAGGADVAELVGVVDRLRTVRELAGAVSEAHGVRDWPTDSQLREVLADQAAIDALDGLAALDAVDDRRELLGVLAWSRIGFRTGLRRAVVLRRHGGVPAPDPAVLAALTGMPQLRDLAPAAADRLQQLLLAPAGPAVASDVVRTLRLFARHDSLPHVAERLVPSTTWPGDPPALWRGYAALLSATADRLEALPRDLGAVAAPLRSLAEGVDALPARELLAALGSESTLPPKDVHPSTIVDLLRLDLAAVPQLAEALRQRLESGATADPGVALFRRDSRVTGRTVLVPRRPFRLEGEDLVVRMSFDLLERAQFWSHRAARRGLDMLGDPDVRVVLVATPDGDRPVAGIPAVSLPEGLLVLDRDVTALVEGQDLPLVRERVRTWAARFAERTRRTVLFPAGSPLVQPPVPATAVQLDARIASTGEEVLVGDAVADGEGPASRRLVAVQLHRDPDSARDRRDFRNRSGSVGALSGLALTPEGAPLSGWLPEGVAPPAVQAVLVAAVVLLVLRSRLPSGWGRGAAARVRVVGAEVLRRVGDVARSAVRRAARGVGGPADRSGVLALLTEPNFRKYFVGNTLSELATGWGTPLRPCSCWISPREIWSPSPSSPS